MKKLLWPLCVIAVLLFALGLGLTMAYLTQPLTYEQIKGADIGLPARSSCSIGILHEGDYPGMSDKPVTPEQAAPGRKVLNALRGQKYTRILPFSKPADGGVSVREINGCTPFYAAYWDGKHLWLPGKKEGQWRGYRPSDPEQLSQALESVYNF